MKLIQQLTDESNKPQLEEAPIRVERKAVKPSPLLGLTLPPGKVAKELPYVEDVTIDAETLEFIKAVTKPKVKLGIAPRLTSTFESTMAKELHFTLEWHMVKDLPPFMAAAVKAMSKTLFEPVTNTPVDNVHCLMSLNEQGPNTIDDVRNLMNIVPDRGEYNSKVKAHFDKTLFEHADVDAYNMFGYTFVLVKDFGGSTVYAWPTQDAK